LPILTIIAGPNGAGKSTHSKELLSDSHIEAFDFDKEFYTLWSQFSYDPQVEQGAFSRAQELYIERRTAALEFNRDFAFESNYHTTDVLDVVETFKSKGYRTELILICLKSPELAIERVKLRVANGGHSVEESRLFDEVTRSYADRSLTHRQAIVKKSPDSRPGFHQITVPLLITLRLCSRDHTLRKLGPEKRLQQSHITFTIFAAFNIHLR